MKLKDRIKADREVFQSLSKEEKPLFIWDYYKIPILSVAIALVLAITTLISWAGKKDIAMYAVFVNSDVSLVETDAALLDHLLVEAGMDMEGKAIDITADLTLGQDFSTETDGQTSQILASLFGISGLDVFAAEQASFDRYAIQDAFVDLSLFIEPELYNGNGCTPYWHTNADGQEILAGIVLHPGSALHQAGYYHTDVVIGVAANAQNLDAAVAFVNQILTKLAD